MTQTLLLPCDGCGQLADVPHISRRLQRLEWTTRFRPVHIQTLLVGGIAPERDDEFLYAPQGLFQGEALVILQAAQISAEGKSRESVLGEFQKLGLALTHVLECPLASDVPSSGAVPLLETHLPAAIARIRRSLKPRRVLLFSPELFPVAAKLHQTDLGCALLPATPGTFLASAQPADSEVQAFRQALVGSNAHAV